MVREPDDPRIAALRGRGASVNPPNRFVPLHVELDPVEGDDPDDVAPPRTTYLRDVSRSAVTYNDSPDIGFEASVNPYRGCEHGCSYCILSETPVLMADGTTRPIKLVRVGDLVMGTVQRGHYRFYTPTPVLAHWQTLKAGYRVTLADGTELVASGDHRFLTERGWKHVIGGQGCPYLTTNNHLLGTGRFAQPIDQDVDYMQGYLCGMVRGDALLQAYANSRPGMKRWYVRYQFRLALVDQQGLDRTASYLRGFEIETKEFLFQRAFGRRKELRAIRAQSCSKVVAIRSMVEWPEFPTDEWYAGFLAGIFDAEGSYSGGILRICNTDQEIIRAVTRALAHFGFDFVVEVQPRERPLYAVRVRGGVREHLRFFHSFDPAIHRKRSIVGQALKNSADLRVVKVESLDVVLPMYDITTGTGDFIANGVVSHNCFARPYHEYLGFSAGLDFETKILVKEDVPELLRAELMARSWKPQVVVMSGVTDCYQPVERKLGITRRCLEVLAEFRNPVAIITKNALVTRDADLLGELAKHGAAAVNVSITSLDRDLQRRMEPRTSTPQQRLDAIRALTAAGVPCRVMAAPLIPGLNDHEVPAILAAAKEAGAVSAAHTLLRLPYAVKDVFVAWLERHFPDRKEKVLNRVRSFRGGKLNDPRFGSRMQGEGPFADQVHDLFRLAERKAGFTDESPHLSTACFRRPNEQLRLFG